MPEFTRRLVDLLEGRWAEPRRFVQVLAGARQTGKTTLVRQALARSDLPQHYASADSPGLEPRTWIAAQWELGRRRAAESGAGAVLVLDEVQKVTGWSEVVKRLWDEDTAAGIPLRVVVLGSAPLLMQQGLVESLAGRFELIRVPHWSYAEMRDAFGFDLDRYVFFGGYPGAAPLVADEPRWRAYVLDSLIETTLARDVLLLTRVDKPALLRQLFRLACDYSGEIVSFQKLLGTLQDAGNTTTLAHYLELLGAAGLVRGLQKFSGSAVRQRGSSPKLLALNTGLVSAAVGRSFASVREDPATWGRLVETTVGAHLATSSTTALTYWRERGFEVDFVLERADVVAALEVKSGGARGARSGLDRFVSRWPAARPLLVGGGGIPLEELLLTDPAAWTASR